MIAPADDLDGAPLLRTEFALDDRARRGASARPCTCQRLGVFEATLNGRPVADDVLSPGWSAYEWRLRYRDLRRRRRCSTDGRTVLGARARQRLVPRPARLVMGGRALYGDRARRRSPSSRSRSRTATGRSSAPTTTWTRRPVRRARRRPLRRPDHRRAPPRRRLARARRRARRLDRRSGSLDFDTGTARAVRRPAGPPPGGRRGRVAIWTSPSGRTLVDFGQNLVGWLRFTRAAASAARRSRVRHAEVLEDDELGTRPLRDAPRRPTGSSSAAARTSSSRRSPSTASATPRSTAGRASSPPTTSRPSSCTPTSRAPAPSSAPTRCSTSCTENVVWGMQGQLPRRAHRLPAARRAARLDRRHRGVRADRGVPLRRRRLPRRLARRPRRSSRPHADGLVPFVVPDVLKYVSPRREDFPTPDSTAIWSDAAVWVPWALWQAYGDRDVLATPVRLDDRARAPRRDAALADRAVGHAASSSATGSTRTRRRTSPAEGQGRHRRRRHRVPLPLARRSSPRPPSCSAATDDARGVRGARATGLASAFNEHYVDDDGSVAQRLHDGLRAGDRASACSTSDAAPLAGDRLAELVAESGYRDLDRLRRHAVHHRRAHRHRAPRRRLPAAAAARVPVVALPGDDGRHHGLGALGLDAARRHASTPAR